MTSIEELKKIVVTPIEGEAAPRTTVSAKEVVAALYTELFQEHQKGFSWETLANRLKAHDINIAGTTLARYMRENKPKKQSGRGAKKRTAKSRPRASTAEAPNPPPVEPAHNPTFHELIHGPSSTSTVTVDAQAVDG